MTPGVYIDPGHEMASRTLRAERTLSPWRLSDRALRGPFITRPIDRISSHRALAIACFVTVLLTAGLAGERLSFVSAAEAAVIRLELASALVSLFAALVLFQLAGIDDQRRLPWVGSGFLVLALGHLGVWIPALNASHSANESFFIASATWIIAGVCFVAGLVPRMPPRISVRQPLLLLAAGTVALILLSSHAPELVSMTVPQSSVADRLPAVVVTSRWYWAFACVPIALAASAAAASMIRYPRLTPHGWLTIAMILLAGCLLQAACWPSTYLPEITQANFLQLALSLLIVVGGVFELRHVVARYQRATANERDSTQRRSNPEVGRADVASMVAHETGSPLAAIRAYADILDDDRLDPTARRAATATIRAQVDHLQTLIRDLATIEHDRFDVRPVAVPLDRVLADAGAFAAALPGSHRVNCEGRASGSVVVDPARIAQVLRNLLSNAANYSSPGTPITLRVTCAGRRVRLEVIDQGFGIPAEDLERIFEKFGRGGAAYSRNVAGSGLGLYIARRIVEAHGSRLTVTSIPGAGSVFGFDVEVAP